MGDHRDTIVNESRNPVLAACEASTRASLFAVGQVRSFEDGTLLYSDGDPAGIVLLPLRGTLQNSKTTSRGRRQIICSPSETSCGGMCMLAFGEHALADLRGLGPGEVLMVRAADLEPLMHGDPVLCRAAWQSAATCMAHLSRLVAQLSFNKVSERVILALLDGTAKDGELVRLTQTELAAEVGTTREVVARCLATLQADNLVRLGRGRIAVLDRARLREGL